MDFFNYYFSNNNNNKKSSGPFPSREFPEAIFPIRKISFHLEDSISSSKILILCNNIRDTQSWIYCSSNCFYSYTIHFGSDAYLKFHTSIIPNLKQLPMSQRTVLRKKKKDKPPQPKQTTSKQTSKPQWSRFWEPYIIVSF